MDCTPEDDCAIGGMMGVQSVALAGELSGLPALSALRRPRVRLRPGVPLGSVRQRTRIAQAIIHDAPLLIFGGG